MAVYRRLMDEPDSSAAQGDVYYVNSSGDIARLSPGTSGYFLKTQGAGANPVWAQVAHSSLSGLTSGDEHTQYALLAGRVTPQVLYLGTASGATAGEVSSTAHATKGKGKFCGINFDEASVRIGVGTASPAYKLHAVSADTSLDGLTLHSTGTVFGTAKGTITAFPYDTNGFNTITIAGVSTSVLAFVNQTASAYYGGVWCNSSGMSLWGARGFPGIPVPNTDVCVLAKDSGTNNVVNIFGLSRDSSGTPAAGFGTGLIWELKSSTTTKQSASRIYTKWVVATHASRTARTVFEVYDTAARLPLTLEASGSRALLGIGVGDATPTAGLQVATDVAETAVITPTALVANTDDWNPTSLGTSRHVRIGLGGGSYDLTGITAQATGFRLTIWNIDTTGTLTLKHDATSTAANRFYCPNSADYAVRPNGAVTIWYDGTSSRWRVLAA